MADQKNDNFAFFREHLQEFIKDPLTRNKFLVIHDREVKGAFDVFEAALRHALAHHSPSEFVIQQAVDESEVINYLHGAR